METYTLKNLADVTNILKGEFGELWLFNNTPGEMFYKCYSENRAIQKQILGWEGANENKGAIYEQSEGNKLKFITFDVIIPRRLLKRAIKLYKIIIKRDEEKFKKASERMKKLNGEGKCGNKPFS